MNTLVLALASGLYRQDAAGPAAPAPRDQEVAPNTGRLQHCTLRFMHGALVAAALFLAFSAPAHAEGTWTFGSWNDGFTPAEDNLVLRNVPATSSNALNWEGANDVSVLTDGAATPNVSGTSQSIKSSAVLTWSFPEPVSIREIRIYATWRDDGRDGINIASVVADGTNTLGGATGKVDISNANFGILSSAGYLATGVSSLAIKLGSQENGYVGYAEIEVIGIVGLPTATFAIARSAEPENAPYSGTFSIVAIPPVGENASIEWRLNGVAAGTGATYDCELAQPGAYTVEVVAMENGVERRASQEVIVFGPVVYVDAQCTTPIYPHCTRDTASTNVAQALTAFSHANELRLYPGTYTTASTITLTGGKSIVGIGSPDEISLTKIGQNAPLLSASGSGTLVRNVTLRKGFAPNGYTGGTLFAGNGARIENCHIFDGNCERGRTGGGLSVDGAGTIVSNCVIGNIIRGTDGSNTGLIYYGLGLYLKNGLVTHCVITNIQAHGIHRAAMHAQGAAVQIAGGTLRNCLVAHNLVTDSKEGSARQFAAGIYQTGGTVENCTVTDNSAQSGPAGYCRVNNGTMVNGIVWGNVNDDGEGLFADGDVSGDMAAALSHCCTNNPLFKAAEKRDYRLVLSSPCANTGLALPWITREATDLAGARRLVGHAVDIGCYEIALYPTTLMLR